MKFFRKAKDGGPESTVTGYWLAEIKNLFSIAFLKFENGSRESYHSHAFNSWSWVLSGSLREEILADYENDIFKKTIHHKPSIRPIFTARSNFHRVFSDGTTWVLTFRGPWMPRWFEYDPRTNMLSTLENGRTVIEKELIDAL